jgi:hypothetical protein
MRFDITVVRIKILASWFKTLRSYVGTCRHRNGSDPYDGGTRLLRFVDNRRQSTHNYTKVYSVTAHKTTV